MHGKSKGTNTEKRKTKQGKKKAALIVQGKSDKFFKTGCRLRKSFITVEKKVQCVRIRKT